MDFAPATVGDIHFYYVLPFARNRALVETTHFARRVAAPAQLEAELRTYLNRLGAGAFEVIRREGGVIPMFRRLPTVDHAGRNILRMGVSTAATKASSGYCYQNTQRQARLIVDALQRGDKPVLHSRAAIAAWFDSVFVRFLEQSPNLAADAFMRLYESVDAEAMVRFLSDQAEPRDYFAVAQALPMLPLGRQALAHVSGF